MPNKKTQTEINAVLERLTDEFTRLNMLVFDGRLTLPQIELSLRKSFGGYYQKRTHRIVLSWQAYEEYGWDETVNTFRHEMAHIVHMHHRKEFWDLANLLGVERKYARSPLKAPNRTILIYECPGCRKRIRRQRRINGSSCGRCDTRYNPKFRFVLVETIKPDSLIASL